MTRSITTSQRIAFILAALLLMTALAVLPQRFERLTPTAHAANSYTWTGAVSSDWFTPGNWSPSGVPGAGDTATINNGTADISGSDATVAVLNLTGGRIQGSGTLTITGTLNWISGDMGATSGAQGTTVIAQGATANISGADFFFKALRNRTLNNAGTLNLSDTTRPSGTTTFSACDGAVLNNTGTMNFGDRGIFGSGCGAQATLNNTGTINSTGAVSIGTNFTNSGTLSVQSGTLTFPSSSTHNGAVSVASGAALTFEFFSTYTFGATSSLTGAGNVTFGNNTSGNSISGTYNMTGTTTIGGNINFNADASIPTLNFTGGRLQGGGTITVTGAMSWTGGFMGSQDGADPRGTTVIPQGVTLSISSGNGKGLSNRTLNNAGTINCPTNVNVANGSTLNNTGTINITDGGSISADFVGSGVFNNTATGTINSTGTTHIGVPSFNNDGTLSIQSGTLTFGNASTHNGLVGVAGGATLVIGGAGMQHNFNAGSSLTGAGNVNFSAATNINGMYNVTGTTSILDRNINFNADASIPTLNFTGGRLAGSATVTVTGAMTWTSGTMGGQGAGNGTTVIAQGATLTITGTDNSSKSLRERTLNNAGTINLTDTAGRGFGGTSYVINNSGTFDIKANTAFGSDVVASHVINNTGTIIKSAGADTSTIHADLNNSGTVSVKTGTLAFPTFTSYTQTAGATVLDGGTLALPTLNLNGGALVGAGIVDGNVVNASTISPGLAPNTAGQLTVTGNYTQTAAGRLKVEIGGPNNNQFDRLITNTNPNSNATNFAGTLDLSLINNFHPNANLAFPIAQYLTHQGEFTTVNGLDFGSGGNFAPFYQPNNLVLVAGQLSDVPGCNGPARPWMHLITPSVFRSSNTGAFRYRIRVLYGNTGCSETNALIGIDIGNVVDTDVVQLLGMNQSTVVRIPGTIFADGPVLTLLPNNHLKIYVVHRLPPYNPTIPPTPTPTPLPGDANVYNFPPGMGGFDIDFVSPPGGGGGIRQACQLSMPIEGGPVDLGSGTLSPEECLAQPGGCDLSDIKREPTGLCSADPNDKVGDSGAGGETHYISGAPPLPYTIFFENKPDATAPAGEVVITDQLDPNKYDLRTFQLGPIYFGNRSVQPPAFVSEYHAEVDLRPEKDIIVRVDAELNKETGLVTWRFNSIDPQTLQPHTNPLAGFLPPNQTAPEGEGSVMFLIQPKAELASGTELHNSATIFFDQNTPIDTGDWLNTLDNTPPSSQVNTLAATQSSNSFPVSWAGTDADSGLNSFTVYYAEDGGPYQPWLIKTPDTSGTFTGQPGKTYAFYTIAHDKTGNPEDPPTDGNGQIVPDATTQVAVPSLQLSAATYSVAEDAGHADVFVTRMANTSGAVSVTLATADGTATSGADYTTVNTVVQFADGETTKTVAIPILDDPDEEGDETINLSLSNQSAGATLGGQTSAVLTITDNEAQPTLSIGNAFVAEPADGMTNTASFAVTINHAPIQAVTVGFATADDTAQAGSDYVAAAGTLTFQPNGPLTQFVNVTINGDTLTEPNETFFVNLSNAAGASLANAQGTGTITTLATSGQLLISEFRFRGPTFSAAQGIDGFRDEYVELYNNTNSPVTVATTDGSQGWTLAALNSNGTGADVLVVIPNGTVIPARDHFLAVNSDEDSTVPPQANIVPDGGYSLNSYAVGDAFYVTDVSDSAGVALFTTANVANFTPATRLDAVGFAGSAGATADLFREGAGLQSPGVNDGQYAFVRHLETGLPQDTDNNAQDFIFVSTDGASYGGVQSILGAPGPENCGCNPQNPFTDGVSPTQRNATIKASLIEPQAISTAPPNRVRDPNATGPNAPLGTLELRRRFKNNTGQPVTRLRFRVVDVTTLNTPNPGGTQADVRWLNSNDIQVTTSLGLLTVRGTLVEAPPQPNGGGLNATGTVAVASIAPGATVDVRFVLGVAASGRFRFLVNVEAANGAVVPMAGKHGTWDKKIK